MSPEQQLIKELVEALELLVVHNYSAEYVVGKYIADISLNSERYEK